MAMMWRRYVKATGYAPAWVYVAMGLGFVALSVWAIVARDWVVAVVAFVMIAVAAALVPLTRRLARGLRESEREHRLASDRDGG